MPTLVDSSEALAVEVSCTDDALTVILHDGRSLSVPLVRFPRLLDATPKDRSHWEFIGGGLGVHWEAIDEDISVASLLCPEKFMRLPGSSALPNPRPARSRRTAPAPARKEHRSVR